SALEAKATLARTSPVMGWKTLPSRPLVPLTLLPPMKWPYSIMGSLPGCALSSSAANTRPAAAARWEPPSPRGGGPDCAMPGPTIETRGKHGPPPAGQAEEEVPMTKEHFDQLETRDPAQRELAQFNLLPDLVRLAMSKAPGWAAHLEGVEPAAVNSRAALAKLPVLRKSALKDLQAKNPPFGGFATQPAAALGRVFMSPGPIFEPEGRGEDWWRTARALFAAGIRKGDIVHNTFAYHLTPGGWILDAGARALGCAVIAAGPGQTEQQLDIIQYLKPTAYVGVPDYLKILLDKAKEAGRDASCFRKALVGGGALFPSLRAEYKARGIDTYQTYATADVGIIAYESAALEGMIVDEGAIVEIVRPGTGDPVAAGEVGEVVVTAFNRDYPMIRVATGDLSAVLPGVIPCGRTNM